jgi:hypothetical protein
MIIHKKAKLNKASFAEVRKGQHIESKKMQVKTYLKVYRNNNWLIPAYSDKLNLPQESKLSYNKCEKLILDYLKLEKKHRNEIVNEVEKKVQRELIKNNIKNILRIPFRIVRAIIKSVK